MGIGRRVTYIPLCVYAGSSGGEPFMHSVSHRYMYSYVCLQRCQWEEPPVRTVTRPYVPQLHWVSSGVGWARDACTSFNVALRPQKPRELLKTATSAFAQLRPGITVMVDWAKNTKLLTFTQLPSSSSMFNVQRDH